MYCMIHVMNADDFLIHNEDDVPSLKTQRDNKFEMWLVGFFMPNGFLYVEEHFDDYWDARHLVSYLNGGSKNVEGE